MYIYTSCPFVQVWWIISTAFTWEIHTNLVSDSLEQDLSSSIYFIKKMSQAKKSNPQKHVDASMCQPVDLQCNIFFWPVSGCRPTNNGVSVSGIPHIPLPRFLSYEEGLTCAGGVYHP